MLLLTIDILASLLLGSMAFFALIVAPVSHRVLEPDQAAAFLRALFPRFYLWGIVLSAANLVACLLHSPKASVLMAFVLIGFLYSRQILTPKINAARDRWNESDSPTDKARFRSLHRRSVLINAAQMALLIIVILAFSLR